MELAPTLEDLRPARHPGGRPTREQMGYWAIEHKECTRCGTTERRHKAHGLCLRCYMTMAKRKARA